MNRLSCVYRLWERPASQDEKYHELLRKIDEEERYFIQKMSLDDCQRFNALSNMHGQMTVISEEEIMSYGFSLGMLLALDVIEEAKRITNE